MKLAAAVIVSISTLVLALFCGIRQEPRQPPEQEAKLPFLESTAYISPQESRRIIEETIGTKAANARRMDLADARQWCRIGWNDRLHDAKYYLIAGGIANPTDEQIAKAQEIVDRNGIEILAPLRKAFRAELYRITDQKIERGEWSNAIRKESRRPGRKGPIQNPPYNGSWVLYETRPEFTDTVIVQVFPGEDEAADAAFDSLQAGYDAFYWDIGEYIKDL